MTTAAIIISFCALAISIYTIVLNVRRLRESRRFSRQCAEADRQIAFLRANPPDRCTSFRLRPSGKAACEYDYHHNGFHSYDQEES